MSLVPLRGLRPPRLFRHLATLLALVVLALVWAVSADGPLGRRWAAGSAEGGNSPSGPPGFQGGRSAEQRDARPASPADGQSVEAPADSAAVDSLLAAQRAQRDGVWVEGELEVVRLLADDEKGSRHQRFLARPAGGDTLLVAHNIDLAPRAPVAVGGRLRARGRFEWDGRGGGILHWTHRDPDGDIPGGYLEVAGERYR